MELVDAEHAALRYALSRLRAQSNNQALMQRSTQRSTQPMVIGDRQTQLPIASAVWVEERPESSSSAMVHIVDVQSPACTRFSKMVLWPVNCDPQRPVVDLPCCCDCCSGGLDPSARPKRLDIDGKEHFVASSTGGDGGG